MNILPRILFLFQAIPVVKTVKRLETWQRKLPNFVWAGRKSGIKMKILCDAKERGGLQMPNLKLYHEAICLDWLKYWMLSNKKLLALKGHNNTYDWQAYL